MFGRNGAKSRPARTTRGDAARLVHLVEDMRPGAQK